MLVEPKAAQKDASTSSLNVTQGTTPFTAAIIGFAALYLAIITPRILAAEPLAVGIGLMLALLLIALSAWDVTTFRLPDVLTLPLIVLGVATAPPDLMIWRALSALVGGATLFVFAMLYRHFRHRDGMGLGDVKLFAAAGAWVGLEHLSSVMLIACAAAITTVVALKLIKISIRLSDHIAFGPFLALGLWIVWIYGPLDLLEMSRFAT